MDLNAMMPKERRPRLAPCCKNRSSPWMEGTLGTTYRDDYVGKEVPVERAQRKYDEFPKMGGPKLDSTTTMGSDYKVWGVNREGPIAPRNTDLKADGPFQGTSMYQQDFGAKESPYVRVRAPNTYKPSTDKFDGTTCHKQDFQPREVPAPTRSLFRPANIPTSAGPFDGASLYRDTFQKQPFAKRQPINPVPSSEFLPGGKLDDKSMYAMSYVPKELSVPQQFRPLDARPQSAQKWFGGAPSTEYRGQFVGKEIPTQATMPGMPDSGVLPNAPFQGQTMNQSDYQPYASLPARLVKPIPAMDNNKAPFTGCSTYHDAFIPKEAPFKLVKPANKYEPNKAPFDGTTTHKTAYQPREVVPTARLRGRGANIGNEQHPFEGASVYKQDYLNLPGSRAQKVLPQSNTEKTGPFDGTTTYRVDYIGKEVPYADPYRPDDCESCVDGIPGVTCREE